MTSDEGPVEAGPDGAPATDEARRRRLAEIFGTVLPESTGDDTPGDDRADRSRDDWYLENRPPHH